MLGEENRGWYVATTQLDFERSAASRMGANRRSVDDLVALAKRRGKVTPKVRTMLADLAVASEVGRLLCYRVAGMQTRGLIPNAEASMGKLFNTELSKEIASAGMKTLGIHGELLDQDFGSSRYWGREYLSAVSATIAGGTSEVQRNILATRGLGLPR
jgi:alkylation response protein AidB-like acyl-CoA dehydrogenase